MLMADKQYVLTPDSLTVHLDDRMFVINSDHPNWKAARAAIAADDWENVRRAMDIPATILNHSEGNIHFVAGILRYKDEKIDNVIAKRILDLVQVQGNFKPLMRFLDRLMENPSRRSVNELYTFLKHKNMPFTPDGKFLAYKSIRRDWTDHHSGKFSNKVGDVNSMTRNSVCDDADIGCSYGFHAGSLEYAQSFGGDHSHVVVVEIDPADVVSVPKDCDCQKLRTATYKVVGVFSRALEEPVVDTYFEGDYDHETGEISAQ
jgi:hypothetical protein